MATVRWTVQTSNVDRGLIIRALQKVPDKREWWRDEMLRRMSPCHDEDPDLGWLASFVVDNVNDMVTAIWLLNEAKALDVLVVCSAESDGLRSQGTIGGKPVECTGAFFDMPQKDNVAYDALKEIEKQVHKLRLLMAKGTA